MNSKNLHLYYIEADDRHLLFLKEFITNTYDFYNENNMNKETDEILKLFRDKKDSIKQFKKQDLILLRYLSNIIMDIFKEKGYKQVKDAKIFG